MNRTGDEERSKGGNTRSLNIGISSDNESMSMKSLSESESMGAVKSSSEAES